MRKILFDLSVCQPTGHIKFHGGGVYGYIVFKELCKRASEVVIAYYDKSHFIEPSVVATIETYGVNTVDASQYELENIITNDISLIYSPLYREEYKKLLNRNILIYITIHGLRKLEMNKDKYEFYYSSGIKSFLKTLLKRTFVYNLLTNHYLDEYKFLIENKNVRVVTVSNHSKSSICYYYPSVCKDKILVYYSPSTTGIEYKEVKSYMTEKYYLILSADRWLKNAYRAMLAFDTLFEKNRNIAGKVIVVGLHENNYLIKRIRHKDRFQIMDYVDRLQLESLLCGAYALIYPTLNEGFGYPPLEAMKYGTPVVASSFSAVSEICGDSVLYSNPYSSAEIAMRIIELEDVAIYAEYRKRSLNRYEYITKRQKDDLNKLINELLISI